MMLLLLYFRRLSFQFTVDSFFLVCCLNIGAHFDNLREKVHEVKKEKFIERHREVLAMAEELKTIFRPIVFIEFLSISFVLCGVGFAFVMAKDVIEQSLMIAYGNTLLVQLFIYCYCGQYLTDRAANVCNEVYTLDRDYKLIIMRTHRRLRIDAPFFRATLEQFASVLQTTWAFISVLKSSV
jgi:hypothetical protein